MRSEKLPQVIHGCLALAPKGKDNAIKFFVHHLKSHAYLRFKAAIISAKSSYEDSEAKILLNLFEDLYGPVENNMENELKMWVIYKNPKDFPNQIVARLHTDLCGATDQIIEDNIESLRARFDSQGFVNIGRFEKDDPCIVEVWV